MTFCFNSQLATYSKSVLCGYTAEPIPLTKVTRIGRSTELSLGHRLSRWPGQRPQSPLSGPNLISSWTLTVAPLVLALGSFYSVVAALLWAPETLRLLQSESVTGRLASMSYWPAQTPTNGSGALFDQTDHFSEMFF